MDIATLWLILVTALLLVAPAAMSAPMGKVTICHIPPGNPGNAHTITISENALAKHQEKHGDTGDLDGPCAGDLEDNKVTICHVPPGNEANAHSITISVNAWPHHLANHPGDSWGDCELRACDECGLGCEGEECDFGGDTLGMCEGGECEEPDPCFADCTAHSFCGGAACDPTGNITCVSDGAGGYICD